MRLRLVLTLAAVMALAVSLPGSVAAAVLVAESGGNGAPTSGNAGGQPEAPGPDSASAGASNYQYSMYRARTHSVQKTDWYCVPTSIQMMFNLIKGESDRSKANQTKYWKYAQENSRYPVGDNGADPAGWVAAMKYWGGGTFSVGVHTTMQAALRAAAKRMRLTGKPVGLIVWGTSGTGGHAWVMTGFKSTADPKLTDDYTVSSVQAMGSLWPYGTINGKAYDPGPKEWVEYGELQRKFTKLADPHSPAWNGRWSTVLP